MNSMIKDRYVLFSLASVCVIFFLCTVGSFNTGSVGGNGMTEMEGIISGPSATQNGTVFTLTDLDGDDHKCFYRSEMPPTPVFCRLIGNFSEDGNIFFVDRMIIGDG